MTEDVLRYDRMVETALRGVVRDALLLVQREGLPGGHHFYITFRTQFPGAEVPAHMVALHPEEITIVIQHQFWDLNVSDTGFEITLSFNQTPETCRVPFAAITGFADPYAKFGLQFQAEDELDDDEDEDSVEDDEAAPDDTDKPEPTTGQVIALDSFRKK